MLILGLSDSHDSSAVLIEDGEILAAVSEERFTRRKRQQGFPYGSIEYLKNFIRGANVEKVYIAGRYGRATFRVLDYFYSRGNPGKNILSFSSRIARWLENTIACTPFLREIESLAGLWVIKKRLRRLGIKYSSIVLVDHHFSHIVSALTGMDSEDYLAVSLDAYGDGKSGLVVNVKNKKVILAKHISYRNSIAQFYAHICNYLGFAEGEEGQVMALAGFGKRSQLYNVFRDLFDVEKSEIKVSPGYKRGSFRKLLRNSSKEDVAFALQETTEEVVSEFIKNCLLNNNQPDLFLSGGLFANIKVNQRLHETKLFNRIFVFPNMGDGGMPFVSVIPGIESRDPGEDILNPGRQGFSGLRDVYLGPRYDDEYIERVLRGSSLIYSEEINIEGKIARLLAEGKTVARFNGGMEYGPRALGNRSILYQTTDRTVNDWLNKKLRRAEYMPFAPVTLFEFKEKCYVNIRGKETAAKFMTIAVDCTDWMKKVSGGVIHVDGTARPQLIEEKDNPSCYKILKEYHGLTGIPSLINTSFNMHGEPIVCSPQEAILTFKTAKLDYLAIGSFLAREAW